jgi:hypothetical protein
MCREPRLFVLALLHPHVVDHAVDRANRRGHLAVDCREKVDELDLPLAVVRRARTRPRRSSASRLSPRSIFKAIVNPDQTLSECRSDNNLASGEAFCIG